MVRSKELAMEARVLFKLLKIIDIFRCVSILISCTLVFGCESLTKPENAAQLAGPFRLELKPSKLDETYLVSLAHTQNFLRGKLRREKVEQVDFKTVWKLEGETDDGILSYAIETVEKDGFVSLHDMGFPELSEKIITSFSTDGKVIQAGHYPTTSIFYVPPVSLPKGAVMVGDTWDMKAQWLSTSSRLPLELSITSIFKKAFECGENVCAELEVSGAVEFVSPEMKKLNFKSQINGRIVFDISAGKVLRSEIQNSEVLKNPDNEVVVRSCLRSVTGKKPADNYDCELKDLEGVVNRPSIFQKLSS